MPRAWDRVWRAWLTAALAVAALASSAPCPAAGAEDPFVARPPFRHLDEHGYRAKRYRAPTPADSPHAATLDTEALVALLETDPRTVLVDVQAIAVRPETELFGISWLPSEPRYNLPGSAWLPNVGYARLDARMDAYFRRELERLTGGERDRSLVVYCVLDCWMSWNAVRRAAGYGYTRLYWYRSGTDGWIEAGHDVHESTPVPIE